MLIFLFLLIRVSEFYVKQHPFLNGAQVHLIVRSGVGLALSGRRSKGRGRGKREARSVLARPNPYEHLPRRLGLVEYTVLLMISSKWIVGRSSPLWGQTVKIRISNYVLKWPFTPTKDWIYPQLPRNWSSAKWCIVLGQSGGGGEDVTQ